MDPGSKERDSRGASLRYATLDETTRRSYEARLQTEPEYVVGNFSVSSPLETQYDLIVWTEVENNE